MPKIHLIDVTNRDGVQTANLNLSKLEKTMINYYLNQMGIWQSEFGFPTTEHETNYLGANLKLAEMGVLSPIRLGGWVRAIPSDIKLAFNLVPDIKHLNLSISTSDQMIQHKFRGKFDRKAVVNEMREAVGVAKKLGAESVGVNAEDASRTDIEQLLEFGLATRNVGANRLRYCDTVGYDSPYSIYDRISVLAKELKMPIEIHCHNDLGMAIANSLAGAKAAIDNGVDVYINTTVNGIGERAGNADLVGVILSLKHSSVISENYELDENVKLSLAWRICKYTARAFGISIPINQPGVGANMFAHASGIHADGVLKDPQNYELYDYEELGRGEPEIVETGREILLGQYSGTKGFRYVCSEIGVEFVDEQETKEVWELVRLANVLKQESLDADEIRFIAKYPDITRQILSTNP